jgi:hypothetical protein
LPPDQMDIEPVPCDDPSRTEPSQAEFLTGNSIEPRSPCNGDLDTTIQPSDASMEDKTKSSRPPRFTEKQKLVLDQWMAANLRTPYPSSADTEQLAQATALSAKQVQQYFSNYRRRHLEKSHLSQVASMTSMQESLLQIDDMEVEPTSPDGRPEEDSPRSTDEDALGVSIEAHPPSRQFNRSSYSPGLEQGNSPDAQLGSADSHGLALPPLSKTDETLLQWWLRVHDNDATDPDQWKDHSEMPSPSSWCAGLAGAISAASGPRIASGISAGDVQFTTQSARSANDSLHRVGSSVYSMGTFTSRGSRRGRRAYGNLHEPQVQSSNAKGTHKCEHCGNAFTTGYTLKRHVQSVHDPNERWVCAPVVRTGDSLLCPTCLEDPLVCDHGMLSCWEKPEDERTFYRKDLLKQHLTLVHGFGSERRTEAADTLALLGMHQYQDQGRSSAEMILPRIGAQLVQVKSACYTRASEEHDWSREMFEPCWARAMKSVFTFDSDGGPVRQLPGGGVDEYCIQQLGRVIDRYEAGRLDAE